MESRQTCVHKFNNEGRLDFSDEHIVANEILYEDSKLVKARVFRRRIIKMNQKKPVEPEEHHKRGNVCTTRPPYRQGRKLTAVKVYTINDESRHLLIFGVPSLKLVEDLQRTCFKYGLLRSIKPVQNYPDLEEFTEVYHVHYQKLSSARFAKKKMDGQSFYGGILHVCYAPELESAEETRAKLIFRRKEVYFKLKRLKHSKK